MFFHQELAAQKKPLKEELLEPVVSTVRIGSIKEALQAATSKPVVAIKPEPPKVEPIKELGLPSADDFTRIASEFAQQMEKKSKRSLAAYFKDPLFEWNEQCLTFIVGSKSLKREIEEAFPALNKLLEKNNFSIDFDFQLNAKRVEEYKLFTPKQQYDALSKKYPDLSEFAQRFGLDFDV